MTTINTPDKSTPPVASSKTKAAKAKKKGRTTSKAKQILVSELALAERTDEEKASVILDEVLAS